MKNFLLLSCMLIIFFTGCSKDDMGCTPVKPEAEEAEILAFASTHGITPQRLNNGIYYEIIDPGTGKVASAKSSVSVKYTGKLLNGYTFSQSNYYTKFLPDVIEGWQLGLPLIKEGGTIKLIIPSVYAYSCNGKDNIPPNSILYFEVHLLHVQ